MFKKDKFDIINLLICLAVILLLFIPTLSRPWLIYDERATFDNSFFPSPASFSEIFEVFKEFGLNFNFISSNIIYSSNSVIRSSPISLILNTFISFFFKKNHIYYHLFILILHIINTFLIYFIIKSFIAPEDLSKKQQSAERRFIPNNNFSKRLILIFLSLIWAIHPVMIESVLLSTNFPRLLTYTFFFGFVLDFLKNRERNKTIKRWIIIPLLFLIPMFSTECMIVLPFVLFIIAFQESFQRENLKTSLKQSFKQTTPYFTGIIIYLIYFFFLSHIKTNQPLSSNELVVFLERVFWLSPQIFFHSLKLIFYPKILSIDQTLFVHLGKTLFDPYAIFCLIFLILWLFVPFYFFVFKRKFPDLFFMSWAFFFALLPFLHILMPSYALSTERYLYCPLAFLIFSLAKILSKNSRFAYLFLFILLMSCFIRTHYRTLDWKDNYSFINSTYKSAKDPLLKAIGLGMLAKAIIILEPAKTIEAKKYFIEVLELLKKARIENKKLKLKFQKSLPAVVKSYGLDYDSLLTKISYLEVSSRCLELNESPGIGIKILEPVMKKANKLDPRIFELYSHLLILENKYPEAKNILLRANSLYPHTQFILTKLFDLIVKYENNPLEAKKYLLDAINYYQYDIPTLTKTHDFYQSQGDLTKIARYAYLYGLRTNSKVAYQQALYLYLDRTDLNKAKNIVSKLLVIDKNDPKSIYLINLYFNKLKDKKTN